MAPQLKASVGRRNSLARAGRQSCLLPASVLLTCLNFFISESFTRKIRCDLVEPRCAYCIRMEKDCVYDRRVRRNDSGRMRDTQNVVSGKKKRVNGCSTPEVASQDTAVRASSNDQINPCSSAAARVPSLLQGSDRNAGGSASLRTLLAETSSSLPVSSASYLASSSAKATVDVELHAALPKPYSSLTLDGDAVADVAGSFDPPSLSQPPSDCFDGALVLPVVSPFNHQSSELKSYPLYYAGTMLQGASISCVSTLFNQNLATLIYFSPCQTPDRRWRLRSTK